MGFFDRFSGKNADPPPATANPTTLGPEPGGAHRVLAGHAGPALSVGFALGGKLVLTGDSYGNVIAWKPPEFGKHVAVSHAPPSPIYCITSGPEDVCFGRGSAIKLWSIGAAFLDDIGKFESFTLGDAHSKEVVPVVRTARELITAGYDRQLLFWDVDTGEAQGGEFPSAVLSLATTTGALYAADAGGFLACGLESGAIAIMNLDDYTPLGTIENAHTADVYGLSYQSVMFDRRMLLASISPADRVVRLWQASQKVGELEAAGFAVAFSPDGRFLAHGHGNDVWIRDGKTHAVIRKLTGHTAAVSSIAWSPMAAMEDRWTGWLATASHDGTARIWSIG